MRSPSGEKALFVAGGKGFYIVDSRTKQVRKIFYVERDIIGPPRLTRDGRKVYFSRRVTEAGIWLLTLQWPASPRRLQSVLSGLDPNLRRAHPSRNTA